MVLDSNQSEHNVMQCVKGVVICCAYTSEVDLELWSKIGEQLSQLNCECAAHVGWAQEKSTSIWIWITLREQLRLAGLYYVLIRCALYSQKPFEQFNRWSKHCHHKWKRTHNLCFQYCENFVNMMMICLHTRWHIGVICSVVEHMIQPGFTRQISIILSRYLVIINSGTADNKW